MNNGLASCQDCDTEVPATARTCPSCGYDVTDHDRWRFLWGVPGTLLTLSLVLAPIGLPMIMKARQHRLAAEGTVTAPRSSSWRHAVGLGRDQPQRPWPPWMAAGEFTRGGSADRDEDDAERR